MKPVGVLLASVVSGCASVSPYELAARNPVEPRPHFFSCWQPPALEDTPIGVSVPCQSARASSDVKLCVRHLERTSPTTVSITQGREALSQCMAEKGWELTVFEVNY